MLDFYLDITEDLKTEVMTSLEEIFHTGKVANTWNESEAQISDLSAETTQEPACPRMLTEHMALSKARRNLPKKGKSIEKRLNVQTVKCPSAAHTRP